MGILATLIMGIGSLISFVFSIKILIMNFQDNTVWGIASLLIGIPLLVYVAQNWEKTKDDFLKSLGGFGITMAGGALAVASAFM